MCSFFIFNWIIQNFEKINFHLKFRGPDETTSYIFENFLFVHNLLHITGEKTLQPFVDEENKIIAIYNGEIYNYKDIGNYKSDGLCIIPAYKKYGKNFVKMFDGEFSLALFDFSNDIFFISTDVFGMKPLWYNIGNGKLGISSYESCLKNAGLLDSIHLKPNTTLIFKISTLEKIDEIRVFEFDFKKQYKNTYDDWCDAFMNAIKKRTQNSEYPVFVCLSSGYDSGTICCCLNQLKKDYYTYTIKGQENMEIVSDRIQINDNFGCVYSKVMTVNQKEYIEIKKEMEKKIEPYFYDKDLGYVGDGNVLNDQACMGLGKIFSETQHKKQRIYLSGQGADEITSDYGYKGIKFYQHSNFGGLFPNDLTSIITNDPDDNVIWQSFFNKTQKSYLGKEETVSGVYGIEGRYPFLDKHLVQEFLYLTKELKNKDYKAPLKYFMDKYNYPYEKEMKRGFNIF
jgi:asparagine synthetase B (glutamine-hydrolysing)